MSLFKTSREKQLWLYATIVLFGIISTLFIGRPLAELISDQNIQAAIFIMCLLLIGGMILGYGLQIRPNKTEIVIWAGFIVVFTLLFLRLNLAERSHMIEYSVLTIFVHKALTERIGRGDQKLLSSILTFLIVLIVGTLDECIQILLPGRIFDPLDIFFNGFAAFITIGSIIVLRWIRMKYSKN